MFTTPLMLPIILLLPGLAAAYECNITFFNIRIEVETSVLCNYVNYHAFMLVAFGMGTVIMLSATTWTLVLNRGVVTEGVVVYAKTAVLCFFLAFGLESWLLFLYLVMIIIFISVPISHICRALSANAVVDVITIDSESLGEAMRDLDEICPICLETDVGKRWSTTACGHSFHLTCLAGWKERTCPMCRADRFR
jgi:hypothetical protein